MRGAGLAVAVLGVTFSCSTGRYAELPEQEQDRFQRCREAMYPSLCGTDRDTVYKTICIRDALGRYSEEETVDARKRWLAAHGCPPAMIEPERHIGGSAAAEPRARSQSAFPEAVEVEVRRQVKERLSIDTGCPVEKIKVKKSAVVSATETAYRLRACTKFYVCTTDTRRVDCRAALAEESDSEAAPDAGTVGAEMSTSAEPRRLPLRPDAGTGP